MVRWMEAQMDTWPIAISLEPCQLQVKMKKVNKQCLLDTPRTVRFSEKTWQVIVQTSRPKF